MRRNYKHTIAVDIDGVVADFEGEFCDRFGYENRHLVNLEARYPEIDAGIIQEFVNSPESYENLAPIFGGYLLLRQAKSLGFYVVLITSRPKNCAEVTREWLEGNDTPYHELWYAKNKAQAIQEYNQMYPHRPVRVLIDDIAENLRNLPDGVVGISWQQEWNTDYPLQARYDHDTMQLQILDTVSQRWMPFWEKT